MKVFWKILLSIFSPILIGTISSCSRSVENFYNTNTINNSVHIDYLNIFNSTTSQDFYNKYCNDEQELRKLFFKNIDKFITYNTKEIKSNFKVIISDYDSEKVVLKITILKGSWYEKGSLNYEKDLIGYSNIIGFNTMNIDDFSVGGSLDGGQLHVDKYKMFVEPLNLKKIMNISNITNQKILDEIRKNQEFKNIVLEIGENSSTSDGVLFLYISGSYNNQEIKKTKITISNFLKNENYKSLKLSNITLNYNQWFSDLKPIDGIDENLISNISTNEWINKYIDSAIFLDSNESNILTLQDIKELGIKIKDFTINVSDKNIKIGFNGASFQNKSFVNNSWQDINIFDIQSIVNRNSNIDIPNQNDALSFLSSKTIINKNVISNYYPSYFSGLAKYAKKHNLHFYPQISNLINNDYKEKIKNKYFPNKEISINIDFNDGSIFSNDFASKLTLNVITNVVDDRMLKHFSKKFEFNDGLKNLNNFFENQKQKTNNILLLPTTTNNNNIASRFVNQLKKNDLLKRKIDTLFSSNYPINEEFNTNLPTASSFKSNVLNKTYIYGDDRENSEENFDNLFKYDFNKTLFGTNSAFSNSNTVDFSDIRSESGILIGTGLFKYDNDNIFQLQSIKYHIDDIITKLIFIKDGNNPNLLDIKIPLKTIVDFNNNKTLEQDSFFSLKLLKNQWNNNN